MRKLNRLLWILLIVCVVASGSWAADWEGMAGKLYESARAGKPFPVLSKLIPEMTLKDSYSVQKIYSQKLLDGKEPLGFKAGLTAQPLMKKFGSEEPLAAVLFPEGFLDGSGEPVTVNRIGWGNLMLEIEVAFIPREAIATPIKDIEELRSKMEFVAPAVELPDLFFEDMKSLKATDINAAAISSKGYILGKKIPLTLAPDLNDLDAVLTLDSSEILRGKGSDALGDQWKAALWLVNKTLEQGWIIKKGDILMTGALGAMIPGKPGQYVYSASALGQVAFTVK